MGDNFYKSFLLAAGVFCFAVLMLSGIIITAFYI